MTNAPLKALSDVGVSVWLDDLDRDRITSGNLQELIDTMSVVGVTTNPSIFEKALTSGSAAYADDLAKLVADGADAETVVRHLTVDDVRNACSIFAPVYAKSHGVDGRVSLEVDPRLANDTEGTIAQAQELWDTVAQPNLMIKIPATEAGLPAITEVIARGISVNVTLIFSVERYRSVILAWAKGIHAAHDRGHDVKNIHSVASFFVSRVDTLVDAQLDAIGTEQATALRGKAALANAQLAWAAFEDFAASGAGKALTNLGAHLQRPLWASTGVKDPAYPDTMYVTELACDPCVNTMPEATMKAVADHGVIHGDTVSGTSESAQAVWADLVAVGINQADVFTTLETEGVDKFIAAWNQLLEKVGQKVAELRG